jgi:hypothetical protein
MTSAVWRKSSWTESGTTSECVEVAELPCDGSGVVQGLVGGADREAREADGQALARR